MTIISQMKTYVNLYKVAVYDPKQTFSDKGIGLISKLQNSI